jgi:hypothetical protein
LPGGRVTEKLPESSVVVWRKTFFETLGSESWPPGPKATGAMIATPARTAGLPPAVTVPFRVPVGTHWISLRVSAMLETVPSPTMNQRVNFRSSSGSPLGPIWNGAGSAPIRANSTSVLS